MDVVPPIIDIGHGAPCPYEGGAVAEYTEYDAHVVCAATRMRLRTGDAEKMPHLRSSEKDTLSRA